ncbi:hypothetical protein MD588_09610, partial [Photobacterium sp. SDRW27]|uniref:hypothetical protein n=1 Tax=Photobacterium obscurum TaxID=2829490 RepID=UPI002243D97F
MSTQLIYLMDPQCGWCFGFSGIMHEIVAHFQSDDRLELSLVTGGLFHPARVTGPNFAEEKRPIAARVEQMFGVNFADDYFSKVLGTGHLDSLVPCQVINAVKMKTPGAEFGFAARLIDAAFIEARDISELSVCLDVVQESGFDAKEVELILSTPELVEMTEKSFEFARQAGTGFPSLFLKTEHALTHLGGAQLDLKTLKARVDAQLN